MLYKSLSLFACAAICGCVNEGTATPIESVTEVSEATPNTVTQVSHTASDALHGETEMTPEKTQAEYNELSDFEKYVILEKGTERGFTGKYTDTEDAGTYICRRCNARTV